MTYSEEVAQTQYSLRTSFFYRARKTFQSLCELVDKTDSSRYDWSDFQELGISKPSWKHVQKREIPPSLVFCHPQLIMDNPILAGYYRSLALLPQKGLGRLAFNTKKLEEGERRSLSKIKAVQISKVINSFISSIIDGDPDFSLEEIRLAAQANLGTQINGSWRNEIGTEGSRRVHALVLKHFLDKDRISEIILKDGTIVSPARVPASIENIGGLKLVNGYKVLFGSEPDISIRNPQGVLEGAIEVKAGVDPAGALERYGAAKKSFDRALSENKAAITFYVATSPMLTTAVINAIANDRLVRKEFNLTQIFVNDAAREEFLKDFDWVSHL